MTIASPIAWGDLSAVAEHYVNRPAYAPCVIDVLCGLVSSAHRDAVLVADVGAGTGKLTSMLAARGLCGYAVEPSDGMAGGRSLSDGSSQAFEWRRGSAEATTLSNGCVNWTTMGTAFHWTDQAKAISEFRRILRPDGFFTAIWDLNDPNDDALMRDIEDLIERQVPNLNRVQANIYSLFERIEDVLLSSGEFTHVISITAPHSEKMSPAQYLGMWKSYHDVPSQIGQERWGKVLGQIEERVSGLDVVTANYRTHSWTVRVV
ncbi:class I SAM-dependent methyltransferase [Mesorhizobium sp. PL10]